MNPGWGPFLMMQGSRPVISIRDDISISALNTGVCLLALLGGVYPGPKNTAMRAGIKPAPTFPIFCCPSWGTMNDAMKILHYDTIWPKTLGRAQPLKSLLKERLAGI